ncbi:MYG1 exonuclease-like [Arctopsyche grandis]|uniref:MYG1 exonuclease-like n=1 Tax=Arctopsyche grandis TaxID=121162 RepID=UPI00406D8742
MLLVTHDGRFHYDETLSTVILEKIYPSAKLIRTRDENKISQGDIVYDVGRIFDPKKLRFDHHQSTFNETFSDKIYLEFFLPADAIDNGYSIFGEIKPRTVADMVHNFNFYDCTREEEMARFRKAAEMVKIDLNNYLEYVLKDYAVNYAYYYEELKDFTGDIYYTETNVPTDLVFDINEMLKLDIKFVITKINKTFRIKTLPVKKGAYEIRYPLHQEWRGHADEALEKISGIPDCTFVHASGFTGVEMVIKRVFFNRVEDNLKWGVIK